MNALLFPGQGSQAVGMGRAFHDASPAARARFDEASDILGYDLAAVCFDGPPETLTRSDRAQPAIFTVSVIAAEALQADRPDHVVHYAAGLSSGEWAALWQAGVVSFADALRILEARGRFMQEACEASRGGMLAVIGLENPEVLQAICAGSGLTVANYNSPGQTVLSGPAEAIPEAERLATEAGARRAIPLDVAGAFHSPLMQPAADRFAAFLADIELRAPTLPVLSNASGEVHGDDVGARMAEQITSPVRWVENVRHLATAGVDSACECGHGKVLAGLVRRIDRGIRVENIQDPDCL